MNLLDEMGATSAEYAILIALIAGAIFATVVALGGAVTGLFQSLQGQGPF